MKQIPKIQHIYDFLSENKDDRELGTRLSDEVGEKYVTMYRAVAEGVDTFTDKDYVTLSRKFAVIHAENNEVYYEEKQQVIQALISTKYLFNASNPGEYFYSGPDKKGKVIYISQGFDFEGYEEIKW